MKIIASIFLLWGTASYAASFDCTKAHSKVEEMICTNPQLSALDEKMATAYKAARQAPSD